MTFFDEVRVLIFAHQNRVRSIFLVFLWIIEGGGNQPRYQFFWSFYRHYRGGGPLINVFLRVYFDVFRRSLRFNFRASKQSSFYIFGVIVDS